MTVLDHEYARHVGYGLSACESRTQWRLYAALLIPAFAIISVLALLA